MRQIYQVRVAAVTWLLRMGSSGVGVIVGSSVGGGTGFARAVMRQVPALGAVNRR